MWNKFMGGKPPTDTAGTNNPIMAQNTTGTVGSGVDILDARGAAPTSSENAAPLTAMTHHGKVVISRIVVNNVNVSPPASLVGGEDVARLEDLEGLDRNDNRVHPSMHKELPAEDSTSSVNDEADAEVANIANTSTIAAPRRGRSSSHDGLAEMMEAVTARSNEGGGEVGGVGVGIGGMLPRDSSSSSSDVPPSSTANNNINIPDPQQQQTTTTQQGTSNFEASLLLGIAAESTSNVSTSSMGTSSGTGNVGGGNGNMEGGGVGLDKPNREPYDPTTLPTSMTSFLDMLTEDQRRVRHRHIPGVEGFRKLYKSEVKSDMSEARKLRRMKNVVLEVQRERSLEEEVNEGGDGEGGGDGERMDVENEEEGDKVEEESGAVEVVDDKEEREERKKKKPHREAFVVPDKAMIKCAASGQLPGMMDGFDSTTNFSATNAMANNGTASNGTNSNNAITQTSTTTATQNPLQITSLTTFDPPRPSESTAPKTAHRLLRWEDHPDEIDVDLRNYTKTVARTRIELHKAQKEREVVERTSSMGRVHFWEHLQRGREEMVVVEEGVGRVNGECLRWLEDWGKKSDGEGGSRKRGRGMKDVLATLKSLGEEVTKQGGAAGTDTVAGMEVFKDWRGVGVGGVRAKTSQDETNVMASGWLLVGDQVIVEKTGEEGTVVSVSGPEYTKKDNKDASPKNKGKAKDEDVMDVDTPTKSDEAKKDGETVEKMGPKVTVKLSNSGTTLTFHPSELTFHPTKLPNLAQLTNEHLAARWSNMIETALANGVDHDALAMEEYIQKELVAAAARERELDEDAAANDEDDTGGTDDKQKEEEPTQGEERSSSPKSVAQAGDDDAAGIKAVLPFGAGFLAAPEDVRNYPSVIPLDELEGTVRKNLYEVDKPRVIATMSPTLLPHEARSEEINALRGKVLQLRNRLTRQKRLRSLNEHSLAAGRTRAVKVEGLLLEMQMDLKNLKERLQDELNELGIGNSPDATSIQSNDEKETDETQMETGAATDLDDAPIAKMEEEKPSSSSSASPPTDTVVAANKADTVKEKGTGAGDDVVPPVAKEEKPKEGMDVAESNAGSGTIETKPSAVASVENKLSEPESANKADGGGVAVADKDELEPESKRLRVEGV